MRKQYFLHLHVEHKRSKLFMREIITKCSLHRSDDAVASLL